MAHMRFIYDAHLGRAFLFLDRLAEYTLLSMTVLVAPCLCSWNEVGDVLCQVSSSPFCTRPFWQMPILGNVEVFFGRKEGNRGKELGGLPRKNNIATFYGEHLVTTTPRFSQSTAIQMGGAFQYKWEAYSDTNGRSTDNISLSLEPRGTKSTAIQIGGVLRYKWEVYCDTFWRSSGSWGFRHSFDFSDAISQIALLPPVIALSRKSKSQITLVYTVAF